MPADTETSIGNSGIPQINVTLEAGTTVTQPTDKTLTIEDMPADAKATGDAIAGVSSDVTNLGADVSALQTSMNGLNAALIPRTSSDSQTVEQKLVLLDTASTAHATAIPKIEEGMAYIANGDTHASIGVDRFVYVKNHNTLSEGLYTATAAIAANETLSSSNLTPVSGGGLNVLQSQTIPQKIIMDSTESTTKTLNIDAGNFRGSIDFVTNNVLSCFSILCFTNSTGAVSIFEKAIGANVTLSTATNKKLTITLANARTGVFFVTASNRTLINAVTLAT